MILYFENENNETYHSQCSFRKYIGHPLMIVCYHPELEISWLKEIEQEIIINEANVRYNFRIQPVKNQEKIYYSKKDKFYSIKWSYPEVLNFTENDTLYIDFSSSETDF